MTFSDEQIIGGFTALGAVIAYLYRLQSQAQKRTETKLDKCEVNHAETNDRLIDITKDLGRLTGMNELHQSVMDEIRGIKNDDRN